VAKGFEKTGPEASIDMFEAEAAGLAELRDAGAVRVPEVYDVGVRNGIAYITMERLRLEPGNADHARRFGAQLADLHAVTAEQHGWHRDNTIGPTPQRNPWTDDWAGFFAEHRLGYQLDLAAQNGYAGELKALGARLAERLPDLLAGHDPEPSLLHGDLWGGNWGVADGEPVIFDPAVYYGDSESDIAMTRLFGGFGPAFRDAYLERRPPDEGSARRIELYQLYHVLNHLNLFGTGYLGQAMTLMRSLLRGL
jgi:fructosamine-3-kinase